MATEVMMQEEQKQNGVRHDKICDYFLRALVVPGFRTCNKGDNCEFIHPKLVAPNGNETNKLCNQFYRPQGCAKGESCVFLHPEGNVSSKVLAQIRMATFPQQYQRQFMNQRFMAPPMAMAGPGSKFRTRVCEYFNTPSGCNRGNQCTFAHIKFPNQAGQFRAAVAAAGGAAPGPIRTPLVNGTRVCGYHLSPRGCSKGKDCKFPHVTIGEGDVVTQMPPPPVPHASFAPFMPVNAFPGRRMPYAPQNPAVPRLRSMCEYYRTERGCYKGQMCAFLHLRPKECNFFSQTGSCKKNEDCEFVHADPSRRPTNGWGLPLDQATIASMGAEASAAHKKQLEDHVLAADVRVIRNAERKRQQQQQQQFQQMQAAAAQAQAQQYQQMQQMQMQQMYQDNGAMAGFGNASEM